MGREEAMVVPVPKKPKQGPRPRQRAKVIPFTLGSQAKESAPILFVPAHVPFRARSRQYRSAWFDLVCFVVLVVLLCGALLL
jgi:hypothetical protein